MDEAPVTYRVSPSLLPSLTPPPDHRHAGAQEGIGVGTPGSSVFYMADTETTLSPSPDSNHSYAGQPEMFQHLRTSRVSSDAISVKRSKTSLLNQFRMLFIPYFMFYFSNIFTSKIH